VRHILSDNDAINEESLKRKTMKLSITEGSVGVFSNVLVENYIIPFSLSINSTPFQIGLLTSIGNLISPLGQLIGSQQIEQKSRKNVLIRGIIGQCSMWLIFIFIAILFLLNFLTLWLTWILFAVYLGFMLFSGMMTPPWFSFMGDIVPDSVRGRYFAKRNLITQLIAIMGTFSLSFLLDFLGFNDLIFLGFIIIFIIGISARLISMALFNGHYYPPYNFEVKDHVKSSQFIKELTKSNFGKFTLLVSLLTLGQWIAKPFFSVYMIDELHFDYSLFIFINLASTLIGLFFFPLLGRFSDKFGNVKLLRIGGIIIPFIPFLWIIFNTPLQIILGIQVWSGIGWTSFNLAASNFIYDNIPSKKRGKYIALYNLLIGISITFGGFIGSIIITFVDIMMINPFHLVFILSGIVRIIAIVVLMPKVKEVRVLAKPIFNVKDLSISKWLYDLTLRNHFQKKKKT
jgi:MFS family permease